MSGEYQKPYYGEGINPHRLPYTRESLLEMRLPDIVEKDGRLPERFKLQFEDALNTGTELGIHIAFLVLDRWRFATLSREKQLEELQHQRDAFEEHLKEGIRLTIHPDDLEDLVLPENIERSAWLATISPTPPDGFRSLPR